MYPMFYRDESKVLQYFGNLFIIFKLPQKHPGIVKHRLKPSFWQFLDLTLRRRTSSLKLPPPFGCWSVASAERKPWIGTSNNPWEPGPDNRLGVASVRVTEVPRVYSVCLNVCKYCKAFDSNEYNKTKHDLKESAFRFV